MQYLNPQKSVEITISDDKKVVWINVDGVSATRLNMSDPKILCITHAGSNIFPQRNTTPFFDEETQDSKLADSQDAINLERERINQLIEEATEEQTFLNFKMEEFKTTMHAEFESIRAEIKQIIQNSK
jgi:hypothetical protein